MTEEEGEKEGGGIHCLAQWQRGNRNMFVSRQQTLFSNPLTPQHFLVHLLSTCHINSPVCIPWNKFFAQTLAQPNDTGHVSEKNSLCKLLQVEHYAHSSVGWSVSLKTSRNLFSLNMSEKETVGTHF